MNRRRFRPSRALPAALLAFWPLLAGGQTSDADSAALKYPAAHHTPGSQPSWQRFLDRADPGAPEDEPQGGRTARGTPITRRVEECFPAESRNLFADVDQVATGPGGRLQPIAYAAHPETGITDIERNAIRGQDTWMLWGEGNEAFWGWLQEQGYGLVDFLVLLDSRNRGHRFRDGGLINQPGLRSEPVKRILGLYLDQADGGKATLRPPVTDIDAATGQPARRPGPPSGARLPASCSECHGKGTPPQLFVPGDDSDFENIVRQLPDDGVDPSVYGYSSGVVGLRLMPNPDYFGNTRAAHEARQYWKKQVIDRTDDGYYTNREVASDPKLIRPFRVSMACAFCHVGPHPLNPPKDPENPEWRNLSSTIGNQYWTPHQAFANLTDRKNFLYHFLASQQPGTIDTSLVSTDNINNANTINALFEVPARLGRAVLNPPEVQSRANLLLPGVEDGISATNPRHTPRVLLDGADSIGVFGALARVFLNIGTYPEEWFRCHNPIIGFKLQSPFSVATNEAKSVYWRTSIKYRVPYLAAFFTLENGNRPAGKPAAAPEPASGPARPAVFSGPVPNEATAPMKLAHTGDPDALKGLEEEAPRARRGREVFLEHCAVCHSSKQPEGFALTFSRDWRSMAASPRKAAQLTLPMDFSEWEPFKKSPAYARYVGLIKEFAGEPGTNWDGEDPFLQDNYLSTDIRVPVTLTGTNSGRSVGTNGMRGQVWDNYSSEDYKNLPAVGAIRFYNPYSRHGRDSLGCNDAYAPPGGGPGYYRPASLVALWATGPYLHNNTLGVYTHDPSVKGRLASFDDGIDKLLSNAKRVAGPLHDEGDLRFEHPELAAGDPGFIYRTTEVTSIVIPAKFIRELLTGVIGEFPTSFLVLYVWLGLAALMLVLVFVGKPRQAAFLFAVLALGIGALLVLTRFARVWPALVLLPVPFLAWAFWLWFGLGGDERRLRVPARVSFAVLGLAALAVGLVANSFVSGRLGSLSVGPIPMGTPVNLIMNMNPEAPLGDLVNGGASLLRGSLMVQKRNLSGADALQAFDQEAGLPLLRVSKCPDFVLDRGHWFGEALSDEEKTELKAFLKTL